MERFVNLEEISDGKMYRPNDMVKAGCNDCEGCSACCRGMGNSIVLDPLDICRLTWHLGCSFEALLDGRVELNVVDGVILPNIGMSGHENACPFLNSGGRCSIHPSRPGFCRLFPLGRYYEGDSFRYFLQVHECRKENRVKVKVRSWIDTPDLKRNERFVTDWHGFLKEQQALLGKQNAPELEKAVTLFVLKHFYLTPYDSSEDFYVQFDGRLKEAREYCSANFLSKEADGTKKE